MDAATGGLDLLNLLTTAGPTTLIILGLLALGRGWVVLPREISEKDKRITELIIERDEYKNMAFRALDIGERITSTTEQHRERR